MIQDETEVISFDSHTNRSQHMLQENTNNATLQFKGPSYDDERSANPLLQQKFAYTNKKKDILLRY